MHENTTPTSKSIGITMILPHHMSSACVDMFHVHTHDTKTMMSDVQPVWLQLQHKGPPRVALQLRMCKSPWIKRFPPTSMAPPYVSSSLFRRQLATRSSAPGFTTPSFSRWKQGPSNGTRTAITERFPWNSTDSVK